MATRDEILRDMLFQIEEAEMRSSALAAEAAALARAGGDAAETVERLYRDLDHLGELRRRRSTLELLWRLSPEYDGESRR